MANTSATGGYLLPTSQSLPGGLTLNRFLHGVVAGISGIPNDLVRPEWQIQPPRQPDFETDWVAFGVATATKDSFAYNSPSSGSVQSMQRHETIEVQTKFYGPNAFANAEAFCDGFMIPQNLDALRSAEMGFLGNGQIIRTAELVNQRWLNRADVTIQLRRQVVRTYQILSFASARGTINTVLGNQNVAIAFKTPEAP